MATAILDGGALRMLFYFFLSFSVPPPFMRDPWITHLLRLVIHEGSWMMMSSRGGGAQKFLTAQDLKHASPGCRSHCNCVLCVSVSFVFVPLQGSREYYTQLPVQRRHRLSAWDSAWGSLHPHAPQSCKLQKCVCPLLMNVSDTGTPITPPDLKRERRGGRVGAAPTPTA